MKDSDLRWVTVVSQVQGITRIKCELHEFRNE